MSKGFRDVRLFVIDILEAIQKIEAYTRQIDFEGFMKDEKTKDAVLRNLEVIGEAVKNIPERLKERYPEIDWNGAAGMRDKLIHEYFGVSFPIVWETVMNDLPSLKQGLGEMLKGLQ